MSADGATPDPESSPALTAADPADPGELSPPQRRGMRSAILAQCTGTLAMKAFENGIVFLYLKALGLPDGWIMMTLALPFLVMGFLQVFIAYYADRLGKKRFGNLGILCNVGGMACLLAAPAFGDSLVVPMVVTGAAIYGLGLGMFGAVWFALLSPVVPEVMRGRFFGRLRYSWQLVNIAFSMLCFLFLNEQTDLRVFRLVILALTFFAGLRWLFYAGIPELEGPRPQADTLPTVVAQIVRVPGVMPFSCYIFLITLFTGCCPTLFNLVEKAHLELGDNIVLFLGTVTMVGSFIGYFGVGRIVDHWGTRRVFVVCHLIYGVVCIGYILRGLFGPVLVPYLAGMHLAFGISYAAASVAISSEMLALIPPINKSVSTSLIMSFFFASGALSGVASGWIVDAGILAPDWTLLGLPLSHYDSLLLLCGAMVMLLLVTLGLVPSVIARAEPYPRA